MQIESVGIETITPYENNAKKHPQEQVDRLAKEISEVGFTQPIVVEHAGVIVCGHGRFLAAKKIGLTQVPVVRLSADISPERVRAIRLFDNKIADTGIEESLLQTELASLLELGTFESGWTGFSDDELLSLLPSEHVWVQGHDRQKADTSEGSEGSGPGEPAEQAARTFRSGQVWMLGPHRLVCGEAVGFDDVSHALQRWEQFTGIKAELAED